MVDLVIHHLFILMLKDAVVDLAAKTVTVIGNADPAALKKAITDADYTVVE